MAPVPPCATTSVPDNVILPLATMGLFRVVKPVVPPSTPTEVTVPPVDSTVCQITSEPSVTRTLPALFV